jgi:lipoprotein-anchoring transpeptidase ErfK/SrfK
VALALIGGTLALCSPASADAASRPASPPQPLYHPGVLSYFAFVERSVEVRSGPSASSRAIERLGTSTADGTSMLVEPLARRTAGNGRIWVEVHMPVLPNSRTGWVPRSALGPLRPVHTWLIVDLKTLRATLIANAHKVFSAPIGVGKASTPTPRGSFYVIDRLVNIGGGGVYGPLAFGTSAKSRVLTDWPGGGVIGIHGTNEPQLIPGRPSHGCIRMRDRDIRRLGRLMPVGTPVTVR